MRIKLEPKGDLQHATLVKQSTVVCFAEGIGANGYQWTRSVVLKLFCLTTYINSTAKSGNMMG